jgi:hypothetical protein
MPENPDGLAVHRVHFSGSVWIFILRHCVHEGLIAFDDNLNKSPQKCTTFEEIFLCFSTRMSAGQVNVNWNF